MEPLVLGVALLSLLVSPSVCRPASPPLSDPLADYDRTDDSDILADYDRTDEEFFLSGRNRTLCSESCEPELCPEARGCRAGLVADACGCCAECANLEGQSCDPPGGPVRFGRCGTGMECRTEPERSAAAVGAKRDGEEPVCVCVEQLAVCASDGRTHANMCHFNQTLRGAHGDVHARPGPCETVPVIKLAPRSQLNSSGSVVLMLCEVFAFPMALVQWSKDGLDVLLPGDDPHISVQSRGGPLKYELSSWLQIEGVELQDSGTYHCVARNNLGSVSASANLRVLRPEDMATSVSRDMLEYDQPEEYDQDYY